MRSVHRYVAFCVALLALTSAACSSNSSSAGSVETTGKLLASEVLHAPMGYAPDQTPGADGTMSEPVFSRDAGAGSASRAGFQGGFKQIYDSQSDNETIEITLLRFASPARARTYLNDTVAGTLSIYSPTRHSYPTVPGAIEFVGTKAYQGIWARAVIATKGSDYMFLVYLLDADAPPPLEYELWIRDQYAALA